MPPTRILRVTEGPYGDEELWFVVDILDWTIERTGAAVGGMRPNDARVRGAGPERKPVVARNHGRPRIPCSRLLGDRRAPGRLRVKAAYVFGFRRTLRPE
jgi:hypothetical protein